jgi:hypothetical protein
MNNTFAIGLYSYSTAPLESKQFKKFYFLIMSVFQHHGIVPTYFAAEGDGYSGKLTKFGKQSHTKALTSEFANMHVLSLVANPKGSTEPGYDSYASASLGYVKETGETLLCVAIEERFLEFGCEKFEEFLKLLIALQSWDFGFAMTQPIEKKPEFHVLGLDDGRLTEDEQQRLNKWYVSSSKERIQKIRDVYPYNIINKNQLHTRISDSETVEDAIRLDSHSLIQPLDDDNLWMWKIELNALSDMRDKIRAALIS